MDDESFEQLAYAIKSDIKTKILEYYRGRSKHCQTFI